MSPENKQRIVGVVVLVAFIALLVPFLFASGIKKKLSSADEIPINAQKRQLIAKQIQSINSAAAIPPVTAEQPANIPQLPELPQDQQAEQPDMLLPPENNPVESLNQSVSTTVSTEMASINTSNIATPAELTTYVAPVKSTPKNKAIKKSRAKPKTKNKNARLMNITANTNTGEFWSVQVGSFSDEARIQKLLTQLHSNGFHVYTQKITTSTGSLIRILVGRETSKEKASQIAGQLETTMKIKGRLIRNQK